MNNEELDFTDPRVLRTKAEEQLKEKQKQSDKQETEPDVKKLMHELQVHQIELEMQNEELRQAYEAAETALKKYTMLYDFAPMGYFSLNSDASICELNFTGAEMLGERRFGLTNSNFKLFVSPESLPAFNKFFSRVFTSDTKESCEVTLGYDNKQLCRVYMEGVVIGDDRQCLLSVINISDFKK
jgi:hypothetical protein